MLCAVSQTNQRKKNPYGNVLKGRMREDKWIARVEKSENQKASVHDVNNDVDALDLYKI